MAMVQLVSYAFTTVENPVSDGGNLAGNAALGPNNRVPSSGVCEPTVTANGCYTYWAGDVVQSGGTWPADQYSSITVLASDGASVLVCGVRLSSSASTGYLLQLITGVTATLYAQVAGSDTQLSTASVTVAPGDVWILKVVGNVLTVTQNGSPIAALAATDSSISSGSAGFGLYDGLGISGAEISLFAAGGNQATTPSFSPPAGSYGPTQTVTLTADSGDTIYYTTDGTTPTHSSSHITSGQTISISVTSTVKAFASGTNLGDSALGTAAYTINGAVTTSTFSPVAGTYTGTQSVTLANADSALTGFAQYYTTDGTSPTTGSTLYTGAITVASSLTIKVLAVATNYSNSSVASAAYTINQSPSSQPNLYLVGSLAYGGKGTSTGGD